MNTEIEVLRLKAETMALQTIVIHLLRALGDAGDAALERAVSHLEIQLGQVVGEEVLSHVTLKAFQIASELQTQLRRPGGDSSNQVEDA